MKTSIEQGSVVVISLTLPEVMVINELSNALYSILHGQAMGGTIESVCRNASMLLAKFTPSAGEIERCSAELFSDINEADEADMRVADDMQHEYEFVRDNPHISYHTEDFSIDHGIEIGLMIPNGLTLADAPKFETVMINGIHSELSWEHQSDLVARKCVMQLYARPDWHIEGHEIVYVTPITTEPPVEEQIDMAEQVSPRELKAGNYSRVKLKVDTDYKTNEFSVFIYEGDVFGLKSILLAKKLFKALTFEERIWLATGRKILALNLTADGYIAAHKVIENYPADKMRM